MNPLRIKEPETEEHHFWLCSAAAVVSDDVGSQWKKRKKKKIPPAVVIPLFPGGPAHHHKTPLQLMCSACNYSLSPPAPEFPQCEGITGTDNSGIKKGRHQKQLKIERTQFIVGRSTYCVKQKIKKAPARAQHATCADQWRAPGQQLGHVFAMRIIFTLY